MTGLLLLFFLLPGPVLYARKHAHRIGEGVCTAYLLFTGEIMVLAFATAAAGHLESERLWLAGATAMAVGGLHRWGRCARWPALPRPRLSIRARLLWSPLLLLIALTLAAALRRAPGNWDGVSYHLPRALYYLQYGSFADFPTATVSQIAHPLLGTIWEIAAMLVSGFRERFFFLPQFLAWLVLPFAALGLVPAENGRGARAWLVFLFSLLPLVALLEAGTEKSDLLVATYAAIAIAFAVSPRARAGFFSLVALGFAVAVKASALPIVPVWAWLFFRNRRRRTDPRGSLLLGLALSGLVVLASGYAHNLQRYHSLIGPKNGIGKVEFGSPGEAFREGTANLFRYLIDAGSPDGWPGLPWADRASGAWRSSGNAVARFLGLHDLSGGRVFGYFVVARPSLAQEDAVSFGWVYFWIFLLALALYAGKGPRDRKLLTYLAGVLFLYLFHSYCAVYDPWHGRFFLVGLIFLVPFLTVMAQRALAAPATRVPAAVLLALLLGQGFYATLFRNNAPLFGSPDRIAQVLRDQPNLIPLYTTLERLVPPDAVLATMLPYGSPEYLLFGPRLGRVVISSVDFQRGKLSLPPNAAWLFFYDKIEAPRAGDQALGEGFFLRRLQP